MKCVQTLLDNVSRQEIRIQKLTVTVSANKKF